MVSPAVVEVIVETGALKLQKPLDYNVPRTLRGKIDIGSRVLVPLGSRKVYGFVVGYKERREDNVELKDVISLFDDKPLFNREQLAVARWMSRNYFCSPQRAIKCVAHPGMHKTKPPKIKYHYLNCAPGEIDRVVEKLHRAPKQASVLRVVAGHPGLTKKELSMKAGVSYQVIDSLIKKDLLYTTEKVLERNPAPCYNLVKVSRKLTPEQESAVNCIAGALQEHKYKVFLLHGVTGGGKTEVYLQSIDHTLKLGRQAIVLVPEISLTPQMIKEFKERFGAKVAVLHSRMSRGERYDEWERIALGRADIVLGARSAIFAPFIDPGIIIVDEEHEFTYKQEESPRYHARAVALYRGHLNKSVVILGSATPSLESYCRSWPRGPYSLLNISRRVNNKSLPEIEVVDMRKEFRAGNKGIFSTQLYDSVLECINKGEQAILFLNRRGFNTFVVCRECGLVIKCPNCDISLTYHMQGKLRCHYCGYSQVAPGLCPECRSPHINYLGTGTQKVEQETRDLFPGARILRMDADTTGRKGSHQRILDSFTGGNADILIGTQMVAKGLNFPGVTLVGIVSADVGLYMPDFRASERTFQLITQVAGRSGRADRPGKVVIQTYNPEHYALTYAARGDYSGFFNTEMEIRKNLQYPPFSRMARLLFSGREEDKVLKTAEKALKVLKGYPESTGNELMLVGPAAAPLSKMRGNFRVHVVLWSKKEDLLRDAVKSVSAAFYQGEYARSIKFSIDIDPYNMM